MQSTPRKHWRLLTLVAVAALSLAVAGIAAAGSQKKAAGAPITTMTIASVNYNGPTFKNIFEASRVYASWINSQGGIKDANGVTHQLKALTCDERGDVNQAENCIRQAVAAHAVAVVGSFTFNADKMIPILAPAKTAWFGICCPGTSSEFSSPLSFPMGSGIGVIVGAAVAAAQQGCKAIGLINLDSPFKPFIESLVTNALKSFNTKYVKSIAAPLAVGDYSAQVAQLTSGTDCIVSGLGESNYPPFLAAMQQAGAHQRIFGAQGNFDQKVINGNPGPSENGISVGVYPDINLPQWAAYRAALKTYKADPKQDYNSLGGLGTWAAFVGFSYVVNHMKGAVNAASFLDAASKTTGLQTKGLVPKINFAVDWAGLPGFNRVFNRAVTYEIVKKGKLVPLDNKFHDITYAFQGKPAPGQ